MPLGALPFGQALNWLTQHSGIKQFQPGYNDPTKPMPGESQVEFDIRRALLSGTHAIGGMFANPDPSMNPLAAGGAMADYMTRPISPTFAPSSVNATSVTTKPPAAVAKAAAPAAMPFSSAAVADIAKWAQNRGATITSTVRSPGHNAAVGGVGNSYHITGQAFDSVPPKGLSMDAWHSELKGRYPQYDVINEGDHVHVEPPQGAPHEAGPGGPMLQAFQSAANATGLNQSRPAFDISGFNQANQIFGGIAQDTMKPFSATYKETPLPELPKPDALQAPDYTAGDKAFAAAAPKNPFERNGLDAEHGKLRMRRADYFAGMAQALGSIDWSRNVGLGELFAKLGAGALMGAKAGDAEVQDRMDKFDSAMQNYNVAVANRDDSKAREQINIANQNVQQVNAYKDKLWATQVADIEKHNPRIENGVLITESKNKDGTVTQTHTPLDPARKTAALMAQAQTAMAQGAAHNEFNWQTFQANKAFGAAALPYAMADAMANGNTQGRDGILAVGLAEGANAVTETGRWSDLYQRYLPGGAQAAQARQREAYMAAGLPIDQDGNLQAGTKIDKDTQERINAYLSTKVMEDFTNSGKAWVLTGGNVQNRDTGERHVNPPANAIVSSVASQREADRKVSRTTNFKGQTSTTERY